MDLRTLSFECEGGWASPLPTALDSPKTVVIAFGAPEFRDDERPFRELRSAFPRSHIVGCSTAGEIQQARLADASVAAAVLRLEDTEIVSAATDVATGRASFDAGVDLARQLDRGARDLRAVLVLSEGTDVNGSELVRGLNTCLPAEVVVTGGLAGDGQRFGSTWTLEGGRLRSRRVSAIGLYGSRVRIGHGSMGGWDIFGPERRITRAQGNVLYELDGRPALDLYKTYLGDRASGLPATALLFPLAIRTSAEDTKRLVRTVLSVDETARTMTFAGDVPVGALAQLMHANFDRLIDGASTAAARAAAGAAGAVLSIAISCVGRRIVLGERTEEETEAVLDVLPPGTQQIGFYSYGELSPYADGRCDLHNQTMTLTTISET